MPPRLKSLELHGYKTFATRTNFEFSNSITAVVGPNGSGKSNIADSIRWVLGEQSYNLLRGKKTEDMIFAGSEGRPRAGMASASITFDNSGGWLPIDYSEVSITRRAYRDGQNEYLMNGQRVRLREINELLAQSGLAERTYTIIGQGLVDAALALKPEERRRLFEEAAGIGLYRARKEEALGRLDATRRNLERVQDILAELEPRLQSLEKQARRFQEYERVQADLRLLLRDWYGYHWHSRQREFTRARESMRLQEERLEQARQQHEAAGEDVSRCRVEIGELRQQLNAWHAQSAENHKRLERVNRDLAILEERQRASTRQLAQTEIEQAQLEEELAAYQQSLEAAAAERARLLKEQEEAAAQAGESRQALLARQLERSKMEKSLREQRQLLTAQETRQVQARAHLQELQNRVETQQRSLDGLAAGIEKTAVDLEKARVQAAEALQARAQCETDLRQAESAAQAGRQRIAELETARRKLQDERSAFELDRSRLQGEYTALEQAEKALTGFNEGARNLIQQARAGRLRGDLQALSQLLDVPAGYEVAVSTALGEYLDLVLLDGGETEAALDFAAGGSKSRVALLPLAWAAAGEMPEAPADADCLGRAVDFAGSDARAIKALRAVLGRVLLVKNRAAARRLLREYPAFTRAVTPQGELYTAEGPVLLGQANRASVISRPRQKRELQERLAEQDARGRAFGERAAAQEKDLAAARQEESSLGAAVRRASASLDKARETVNQRQLASEQLRRQHEFQTGQKTSLETQLGKAQQERAELNKELSGLQTRITEQSARVRQMQTDLNGLPLDELQTQVNHWDTAAAVAARASQEAEKRVADRSRTLERARGQRASLAQRLGDLRQSLAQVDVEKNGLQTSNLELSEKIRLLQEQIDPVELEMQSLQARYEALELAENAAQQAFSVAERHHTQVQLEVVRQREALDSLRRRIEDDFGLVVLDYEANIDGPTPLPMAGVEQLPVVKELPADLEESISRQRLQLRRLGAVNPEAQVEYLSVKERHHFMTTQVADLRKAESDLRQVITELDDLMRRDFRKTFNAVAVEFRGMFARLFVGGSARLVLSGEENLAEAGIDIEARLPGRREQGLSLLSGGERSLTAVALVFALLKVAPTPFCVMDEVDAMLDESNVGRFCDLLRELSAMTQFIVITHNRNTVQTAEVIYGITLGRDSSSQMISLRLDEVSDDLVRGPA
jgi:chromosome segregation protein